MSFGDLWNGVKKKVEDMLYNGEAEPAKQPRRPKAQPAPQEDMGAPVPEMGFNQQGPQYGYYQDVQGYGAPQQGYQAPPQQPVQQQPVQPQYHNNYQQQGYQPPQQAQPQQGGRFGRFSGRDVDNVVSFKDYQHKTPEAAPQQPVETAPQPMPQAVSTRVVCVRSMADCRRTITLLRMGDAVLATMEMVKDPAELRRLVDMLSGASYSLNASFTKVSRVGVYLLAPAAMPVFIDQMINQMNGMRPPQAQTGPQQPRPQYQSQPRPQYQPSWEQQPMNVQQQPAYEAQPQNAWQPPQQAQQPDGFTRRTAAPQEDPGVFYARPQQNQPAQMPAFYSQSANTGYVPDDVEVAE